LVIFSRCLSEGKPTTCRACGRTGTDVSEVIGVCADCLPGEKDIDQLARGVHAITRDGYSLPSQPPRSKDGRKCRICVNSCSMGKGEKGFCGLRGNRDGHLAHLAGTARVGLFRAYHDSLPTNCVGDWVCPGGTDCGYPDHSYRKGPEFGYFNLAVFLVGCSFDCVFCQNWTFRDDLESMGPTNAPEDLASMVNDRTSCICYFGGDPSPQLPFAIRASEIALERNLDRILRICWETNGSMHPGLMRRAL